VVRTPLSIIVLKVLNPLDMRASILRLVVAGLLVPVLLSAQDPAPPKRLEFTGDLSFVSTTGNSEVATSGATDKLIWRPSAKWTMTQTAGIVYGRSDGDVVAENYRAAGKADYALGPVAGAYGLFAFDRNVFSGIAARYELSAGLSAKPVNTDRDIIKFEAGVARILQRNLADSLTRFFSGRVAGGYKHLFTTASYFEIGLELMPNLEEAEDLRVNGITALVAPISSHIGLKAAYEARWDNLPEPGFEDLDTVFRTGVQITF
jgi:putative salt-induced outer membrane protein YdiY